MYSWQHLQNFGDNLAASCASTHQCRGYGYYCGSNGFPLDECNNPGPSTICDANSLYLCRFQCDRPTLIKSCTSPTGVGTCVIAKCGLDDQCTEDTGMSWQDLPNMVNGGTCANAPTDIEPHWYCGDETFPTGGINGDSRVLYRCKGRTISGAIYCQSASCYKSTTPNRCAPDPSPVGEITSSLDNLIIIITMII